MKTLGFHQSAILAERTLSDLRYQLRHIGKDASREFQRKEMQCRHREAARSNDEAGVCMPRHSGTGQTVRQSLATNHAGQIRTAKENVGREQHPCRR